jgi:shikimate kinase
MIDIDKHLFLIGLPGSGKSTLGAIIAKKLKHTYIDLDKYIEENSGYTISQLFDNHSGMDFRLLEQQMLQQLIKTNINSPIIIACGGGTPCYYDNLVQMKMAGYLIWLKTPINIIKARLIQSNEQQQRPLFKRMNTIAIEEKLNMLLQERSHFYSQSDIIIPENILNNDARVAFVIEQLNQIMNNKTNE